MRKIFPGLLIGGALLLAACGGPAVNNAANEAASAVTNPTNVAAANEAASAVASAVANPTTSAAISGAANQAASAIANPTTGASVNQAATAVTGPEAATAVSEAAGALSAVANDVTIQQGEALVLDATRSVGNITEYKWTIQKAPTGAESVVGQVIKEGSNGNVSIDPNDYVKYFPTAGTYTVRLTVTDASGQTSSTDFDVDVP